jgi:O-antigen/teichoic acid export membrane protein
VAPVTELDRPHAAAPTAEQSRETADVLGAVLSSTAVTTAALLIAMALGAVRQVVIARTLGPTGYGTIGLAESFENVLIRVAPLGLTTSIPLLLTRAIAHDDRRRAGQVVVTASLLGAALVLAAGLAMIVFGEVLAGVLGAPSAAPVLRLWGVVIIGLGMCQIAASILRGLLRMGAGAMVRDVLPNALLLVGVVVGIGIGWRLPMLAVAYAAGALVAGVSAMTIALRAARARLHSLMPRWEHLGPLLMLSVPVLTMALSGQLVRQINVPILAAATDLTTVGLFTSALFLASTIEAVFTSLTMVYMPFASKVLTEQGLNALAGIQPAIGRWTFLFTLVPVALLCAAAEPVLRLLFGPVYVHTAGALRIILLGLLAQALVGPRNSVLLALGRARAVTTNFGISLVVAIAVSVIWIPSLGLTAAALSFAAAFAVRSAISERQLAAALPGSGLQPRDAIGLVALAGVAVGAIPGIGPLKVAAPLIGAALALATIPITADDVDRTLLRMLAARMGLGPASRPPMA